MLNQAPSGKNAAARPAACRGGSCRFLRQARQLWHVRDWVAARDRTEQSATEGVSASKNQAPGENASRVISNTADAGLPRIQQTDATTGADRGDSADVALAHKVRVALSTGTTGATGVYSEDLLAGIGVTATNGVVTLTGTVGDQSVSQAFEARAKAIGGVKSVHNELRVAEGAPSPAPGVPSGSGEVEPVPQQDSAKPRN